MSVGLYEILEKIRVRPGMYIGKASVTVLFDFLVGYKTARRELGIELTDEDADFCIYKKLGYIQKKRW
jgi:DNA gyrase/topoisomerase IV subunit B